MGDTVEITYKGDVKRLELAMGDKLLICFDERLPRQHILDVRENLQQLFPRNEVLVLAGVGAVAIIPGNADSPVRI